MGERLSLIKPAGHAFCTNLDGALTEMDTWQCGHCGGHHNVVKGSGRLRAFCTECSKPVCVGCAGKCVPTEQLLENIEQGRPLDFRPIRGSVPRSLTQRVALSAQSWLGRLLGK